MKLAWSNLARRELMELRRFSVSTWGQDVALRYLEDIRDSAKQVATNHGLAKPLKGQLRILRVRSHYLIVDVDELADRLTVVRVVHTAADLSRHLD